MRMTKSSGLSRTLVLVLALLILLVVSLSVSKFVPTVQASPSYEDFTGYTEVDPNSHIAKTANHVDFQDYRTEDAYLYKDKGAGHFTDFTHKINIKSVSGALWHQAHIWLLSNDIDDAKGLLANGKTAITIDIYKAGSGVVYLTLEEFYTTGEYGNSWSPMSENVWYYLTIQKSGTALTCKVYSDSARTTLLTTLSLTLHANHNFRYVFVCNTWNSNSAGCNGDEDVENLDLQETVSITVTSSPAGSGYVLVDGGAITTPQTYSWSAGSSHTIAANSPANLVSGQSQYVWTSWSDSGAQSHLIIVPSSATTYTANFQLQYYITITSSGIGISGTVGGIDTVNSNGLPVNRLDTIKVTLNAPVVVTQISEYFITSLTTHIHMGIYTDSNGPSSLVSGSDTGQLTISSSQTLTYNYSTPIYLATGSYWLAYIHDLASGISYGGADSGVANTRFYATQTYGALPSTYPSGSSDTYSLNRGQLTSVSSDTTGTVATLGGNAKTQAQLPYSQWFNNGESCSYTFSSPVTATTLCEYYNTGDDYAWPSLFLARWEAQTFTVGTSQHTITSVKIKAYKAGTAGIITLGIRAVDENGKPTGSDLTSGTVDGNTFTTNTAGAGYEISVTEYTLSANTKYAIVIRQPNTDAGYIVLLKDSTSPSYTGGTMMFSSDSGVTWTVYNFDDMFEIWGNPMYPMKQYVWSSTSGLSQTLQSNSFIVSTYGTITGAYLIQWQVTFTQIGLNASATGTVVTVDGTEVSYGSLSYSKWVYNGATVTYSYSNLVSSSTTGKRFSLSSVSGSTSPITMTSAVTVTGNYVVQWQVTFTHTGLDSSAIGTVVTVDGSAKAYADLPFSKWVNSGTSVTYLYSDAVSSSTTGKRFSQSSVTGPTSPITVTSATTVTGDYGVQWQITFTHTGLDSSATGTVVTVNGASETYGNLPYTLWINNGGSVTYSYSSTVSSSTDDKRFSLSSVLGLTSPVTVTSATTVTGAYVVQWQVTFTHSGLDSSATGDVVTVDETGVQYGSLPYSKWVYGGATVTYVYSDPVSSTPGKRFRLTDVTGSTSPITVTSAVTITGTYTVEFNKIKIIAGGVNNVIDVGTGGTVWYQAVYEWDNTPFTGSCGTLYLNGTAMNWTTDRWTYAFPYPLSGGQTVFSITGVLDIQYGLTEIHNVVGNIVLNWATMEISIVKP